MTTLIVLGAIFVALFAAAYTSKRRFGILGLAVTAGYVLSGLWGYDAGLVISGLGIVRDNTVLSVVVPVILILLPAVVLFFTGYKYKSVVSRTIGSAFFAAFTLAFLVAPISKVLPIEGFGATIYSWLSANSALIISAGVVLAVTDLFLRKPAPPPDASGKKKK